MSEIVESVELKLSLVLPDNGTADLKIGTKNGGDLRKRYSVAVEAERSEFLDYLAELAAHLDEHSGNLRAEEVDGALVLKRESAP